MEIGDGMERPIGLDYDLSKVPDLAVISGSNATGKTLLLNRIASAVKNKAKLTKITYLDIADLKYVKMSWKEKRDTYLLAKLDGLKGKGNIVLLDDIGNDAVYFKFLTSKLKELHTKGKMAKGIITQHSTTDFKVMTF
jgi:predicted AAA+ superfamily ATPase